VGQVALPDPQAAATGIAVVGLVEDEGPGEVEVHGRPGRRGPAVGGWYAWYVLKGPGRSIPVPEIVGRTAEEAQEQAAREFIERFNASADKALDSVDANKVNHIM